jgi:hypothetical protein
MDIHVREPATQNPPGLLRTLSIVCLVAVGIHQGAEELAATSRASCLAFGSWIDGVMSQWSPLGRFIGVLDAGRAVSLAHVLTAALELVADWWFLVPLLFSEQKEDHSAEPQRALFNAFLRAVQVATLLIFLVSGGYTQNRQLEVTLFSALLSAGSGAEWSLAIARALAVLASLLIGALVIPVSLRAVFHSDRWALSPKRMILSTVRFVLALLLAWLCASDFIRMVPT